MVKAKKKKYLVVTSFSEKGYHKYGKKFISSWAANWPKSVDLIVYHHSEYPTPVKPWVPTDMLKQKNIKYGNLDEIPELKVFKDGTVNLLKTRIPEEAIKQGAIPWQLDALKFTNKVFALAAANATVGDNYEWIIWLDADTITNKKVSEADIDSWVSGEADLVHLGRKSTYYSETSFVAYKVSNPRVRVFLSNNLDMFLSGEFQFYGEWHDGFIFERLLNIHKWHGLKTKSLTPEDAQGLAAFKQSVLGNFMTHLKGNLKDAPAAAVKQANSESPKFGAYKVNPTDCVDKKELLKNIKTNTKLIDSWLVRLQPHKRTAVVVSGGPSLEKFLPKIKQLKERGADIFCVKHSFPRLVAAGITPDFCVILDPRELTGVSTLGKVRKDLFKEASTDTLFLLASMTHPSVTRHFIKRGLRVLGFHTFNNELVDFFRANKGKLNVATTSATAVGTCSAIRTLGILELMGYSKTHMVGFDSNVDPEQVNQTALLDTGKPKYVTVGIDEANPQPFVGEFPSTYRKFLTTGEFVALYQDFMHVVPTFQKKLGMTLHLDDNSLIGYGWKQYLALQEKQKKLEEQAEAAAGKPLDYNDFFQKKIPCYN